MDIQVRKWTTRANLATWFFFVLVIALHEWEGAKRIQLIIAGSGVMGLVIAMLFAIWPIRIWHFLAMFSSLLLILLYAFWSWLLIDPYASDVTLVPALFNLVRSRISYAQFIGQQQGVLMFLSSIYWHLGMVTVQVFFLILLVRPFIATKNRD
jgi:hypothetical protein